MAKKEEKKVAAKDNKDKALSMAVTQIEKQFGKGSIMRLGEETKFEINSIRRAHCLLIWPSVLAAYQGVGS